jgi:hypothetical protein
MLYQIFAFTRSGGPAFRAVMGFNILLPFALIPANCPYYQHLPPVKNKFTAIKPYA